MKKSDTLFIYNAKEMRILFLLVGLVAFFGFTLGVHYGKAVPQVPNLVSKSGVKPITAIPDQIPNRQELTEQSQILEKSLDKILQENLKAEVDRSKVRLKASVPVRLPQETKMELSQRKPTATSSSPQYHLRAGAFLTEQDAYQELRKLSGLTNLPKSFVREVDVTGVGKRFCIFLGPFSQPDAARATGDQLKLSGTHVVQEH